MKVYQQKVLRMDINPLAYKPSLLMLDKQILLTPEVSIHTMTPLIRRLGLIWKVRYIFSDTKEEVVGLLLTHDHLLEDSDLTIEKIRSIVSMSALNVQSKLEESISTEFFATLDTYKVDTLAFANTILTALKSLN